MLLPKTFKKLTLLVLLSASLSITFSQENFVPGFVITLQGDTLKGQIDYRKWSQNPNTIAFKKSSGGETMQYAPLDISGFGIHEELYKSAIVQTENSPHLVNELNAKAELLLESDTVFLYCLVSGNKGLYHFKDLNNKDHFYISTDTSFNLLIHKSYIKILDKEEIPGVTYAKQEHVMENKTYIGQLMLYFQDCKAIKSLISQTEYSQGGLYRLFQSYQKKCNSLITIKKQRKMTIDFGIAAGVSMNSLKFKEEANLDFAKTSYDYKLNYAAGILLDLKLPGKLEKWSVYNEILYAPYKVEGEYNDYINPDRYTIVSTEFGVNYLKINNMIRFSYPVGNFFLFVNAGISNSFGSVSDNYVLRKIKLYSEEETEDGLALNRTDKYELAFNLGFGLGYKNWSLETRWEQGDGMSALSAMETTTTKYFFMLGYRF